VAWSRLAAVSGWKSYTGQGVFGDGFGGYDLQTELVAFVA